MPTRQESEAIRREAGLCHIEARGPFEAAGRAIDRIGARIRKRRAARKAKKKKVSAADVIETVADVVKETPAVVASVKKTAKAKNAKG